MLIVIFEFFEKKRRFLAKWAKKREKQGFFIGY